MTRPAIEVADIVRRRGRQFLERFNAVLSYQQLKAYRAVERCRTAALGGHKDKCVDCQYEPPISYNSCRSRCCASSHRLRAWAWHFGQQRERHVMECTPLPALWGVFTSGEFGP